MAKQLPKNKSRDRPPLSPPAYRPMAAPVVDGPFDQPGWIFEPKFDGLRVLVCFDGGDLTLLSRNDKPQEAMFLDVAGSLRQALPEAAVADGEIVCFDAE